MMQKILLLICLLLVLTSCTKVQTSHEFAKEDIFLIPNVTSEDITLYGLRLGDSVSDVVRVFGEPDNKQEFILEGETNLEYGQNINLTDNGLIFHFDNGTLTRMTIKKPFTEHYLTKTQLNFTKIEVYNWMGLPDSQRTALVFRIFTYDLRGIDVFLKGRDIDRVSLFRKP